jgi:hypothetical protein
VDSNPGNVRRVRENGQDADRENKMRNTIFKPGDVVEFWEFWGGYNVLLKGVVVEATSYRLSVQSVRGTTIGKVFDWVSPNSARPFVHN